MNRQQRQRLFNALRAVAFTLLEMLYGIFGWGIVTFKFYNWFIQPVFYTPKINYWEAVGIYMFLCLFKTGNLKREKFYLDKVEIRSERTYSLVFWAPWVVLFIGWVLKALLIH